MPNKGIITHNEIAEPNLTKPVIDDFIALLAVLNHTEAQIKDIAKALKTAFKSSDFGSTDGLNKFYEDLKKATQAANIHADVIKKVRQTKVELNDVVDKTIEQSAKERLERELYNKQAKEEAKLNSEKIGAYDKLNIRHNQMRKNLKDMAVLGMQDTEAFKKLNFEFQKNEAHLRNIDALAGQHQRNVGNYADGYRGLHNSINQITREMPAFANTLQTGFMAISNNLPIFIDQINQLVESNKRLNAEGQKTEPVWKSVARGLFSVQTLFSVGITLLTVYGEKLVTGAMNLIGFESATKKAETAQKEFNKQVKIGLDYVAEHEKDNLSSLERDRAAFLRAAEERKATAQEIFEINQDFDKRAIRELETYNKKRDAMVQTEVERQAEYRRKFKGEDLDKLLAESESRVAIIEDELSESNALRESYLQKYENRKAERYQKQKEDDKKAAEEALKLQRQRLEQQHEINQNYIKAVEDEYTKELGLLIENHQYQVELTKLTIEDSKVRNATLKSMEALHQSELSALTAEWRKRDEDEARKFAIQKEKLRHQVQLNEIKAENKGLAEKMAIIRENAEHEIAVNKLTIEDKFDLAEANKAVLDKMNADLLAAFEGDEDARQKHYDKIKADDEKRRKEEEKALQQFYQRSLDTVNKFFDKQAAARDKNIANDIEASQKRQDDLKQLAAQGNKNAQDSIALEEQRQQELELKREKVAKNAARREMSIAVIKAYTQNLSNGNPTTALTKTLKDLTAITAAVDNLPSFDKGTENTGDQGNGVDGKGGFHAILHPNERVLTKSQNRKIGEMTNEELADLAFMYQRGILPELAMSRHVDDRTIETMETVGEKIDNLTEVIKNRPVKTFRYDEVNKMVVDITQTQFSTERRSRRL